MDDILKNSIEAARSSAKMAHHRDKVFKDECMFCFRTPFSPGGVYVNLSNFQCFCRHHAELDQKRSGSVLYLHIKQTKVPLEASDKPEQPTELAIGVPGGFDVGGPKERVEEECSLAVMPTGALVPLPCADLPAEVLDSIVSIQAHDSASLQADAEVWVEERQVSKYAEGLEQLPCNKKIPMDPKQWKCEETGVGENLWLNLATGFIGSGRAHWDGSGGNGAAMRHFEALGKKYPLVVKLGTITPSGADVYSYADEENDMVLDPKLAEHLAHWGINILQMEKTEKTMAELQVEKNLSYEFDKITEAGAELRPVSGKGFVGLKNLGNSCYMNSVLQLMWTVPELQQKYLGAAEAIYAGAPSDVANDFISQFTKVGSAIAGEEALDEIRAGIISVVPRAFKTLVGRGHSEFASSRQQDAQEYFSYLVDTVTRAECANSARLAEGGTAKLFEFSTETRIECLSSHKVSYKQESSTVLSLEIPTNAAVNFEEVAEFNEREQKRQKLKTEDEEEKVLPRVPFSACMERFSAPEEIEDYYSAYLKSKSKAIKSTRFSSFSPYIMVHLRRYYVGVDWTAKKLEVLVDMPEYLSLESLRSRGVQAGEELQPEETNEVAEEANEALVVQLVSMGFPEQKCKRAVLSTGNADVEAAMEWLLLHGHEEEEVHGGGGEDLEKVKMLQGMGFAPEQAKAALAACSNDVERAVDWLFSRAGDEPMLPVADAEAPVANFAGGSHKGIYELVGFLSHIGKNTGCGHYVCHIKKDGNWTIYNDEKVAVSAHPPKQLGYMYLYKRTD